MTAGGAALGFRVVITITRSHCFPYRAVAAGPLMISTVSMSCGLSSCEPPMPRITIAAGIERPALVQIESPDANVRLETLERVAAALGLQVDLNLIPMPAKKGAA